ncbi:MAG: tyrosine-type recombinase/integrase [Clostridia bacterium]|nr:tyrosine-type recombinase/integrase [Clostridia bacterium]
MGEWGFHSLVQSDPPESAEAAIERALREKQDGRTVPLSLKELQRVKRSALEALDGKDVFFVFPSMNRSTKTVLVLKNTKTESSKRNIYLPKTVADMLVKKKEEQESNKEALGEEYQDYNLVFAGPLGNPTDPGTIRKDLNDLIRKNNLPPIVFHSLRHSSITTKLKLSGGDIKSVQGDSGHAQSKMVTDLYAHILDDDRRINAQRIEEEFYSGRNGNDTASAAVTEAVRAAEKGGIDPAQLVKLLSDPAMAALIKSLAANIK